MKIHEVMQLTGLTRKAVYYYERAGLLAPMTDPDNRYRNYSDEDIERLKLISTLRKLEMPVADIREMVAASRTGRFHFSQAVETA